MADNTNDKKNTSIEDELDDFLRSDKKKDKNEKESSEEIKTEPQETVQEKEVEVEKVEEKPKNDNKKDFLSSLGNEKKPESFQEEEVIKIEKKPIKISKNMMIAGGVGLVLLVLLGYFMFFAPNMTMPDFVGGSKNDVQIWMRQNSINSSDVIVVEEYNFDFASGEVISQSITANARFRKGAKVTIVISKGADPEEAITFPDIKNMTYVEIVAWRDNNKLLNVKINQVYHDTIAEGEVISYDLRNVMESDFKRGTNLTIQVSRGKQPVQQVTVQDFTGKTLIEMQSWADTNKLKLDIRDSFTSDETKEGKIASQSPTSGSVDQGSTIIVNVYRHAATMTNLVGKTTTEAVAWCSSNGVSCSFVDQYHDSVLPNRVISQSVASGKIVEAKTPVTIYISVGRVDILEFSGTTISELRSWVEDKNSKLAGLNLSETTVKISTGCSYPGGASSGEYETGDIIDYTFPIDSTRYGYLKYGDVINVKVAVVDESLTAGTSCP